MAEQEARFVDGQWVVDSPMGRVVVSFAPANGFGVLHHDVTLPTGETVRNPMRVIANGDGCDVVFTVRRRPGMTAEGFAADVDAVTADLATLRDLLEAGRRADPWRASRRRLGSVRLLVGPMTDFLTRASRTGKGHRARNARGGARRPIASITARDAWAG